ncbi:allantoate amidohydrolase [Glaciecola sp. KUL10]|uniref:allantoate amidohydrolase n=1 Tax=Glaciecola sp. (strain KUL10) TaxID=2161813 RepID=UPI000D789386|nr:allantoate amidohydrolase [Glaciecola sp. KUL10]GBL05232.1 hydantoin utilization protein C [Glaciecola sp. KUL10]
MSQASRSHLLFERAQWVMQACEDLGAISQSPVYVDRRYLTKEHKAANSLVMTWMKERSMRTWEDAVGNVCGRLQSKNPNAKSLLFGSHLDTVVNGGKYDGMLGVIAPLALVDLLLEDSTEFPFHIDIVGFCDEEGTRFGSTLLGSRALTGKWQREWANLQDADGKSLRQAMQDFGLNFDAVDDAKLDSNSLLSYVEVHIEQGPVLEEKNLPVGVVSAITGAKRFNISLKGMAGHAGTVPMANRQDALLGASEMVLAVEQCAIDYEVVATVGKINNSPNAVNVISGMCEFSLDVRSDNDQRRDAAITEMTAVFENIAKHRALSLEITETHQAPAILCSQSLIRQLGIACVSAQVAPNDEPFQLLSGAGHDAMAMAEICEVGMLFVRCDKGISHHPKESILVSDVQDTLAVLQAFVMHFEQSIQ